MIGWFSENELIGKDVEGSGHGLFQDIMPSGTKEHHEKSVRIVSALIKIQIRHLLNTS
jgi:hypothetical protein